MNNVFIGANSGQAISDENFIANVDQSLTKVETRQETFDRLHATDGEYIAQKQLEAQDLPLEDSILDPVGMGMGLGVAKRFGDGLGVGASKYANFMASNPGASRRGVLLGDKKALEAYPDKVVYHHGKPYVNLPSKLKPGIEKGYTGPIKDAIDNDKYYALFPEAKYVNLNIPDNNIWKSAEYEPFNSTPIITSEKDVGIIDHELTHHHQNITGSLDRQGTSTAPVNTIVNNIDIQEPKYLIDFLSESRNYKDIDDELSWIYDKSDIRNYKGGKKAFIKDMKTLEPNNYYYQHSNEVEGRLAESRDTNIQDYITDYIPLTKGANDLLNR